MAGDYHFSPEAEKRREDVNKKIQDSSKKYNEKAFTKDSKMSGSLAAISVFESAYEALCYNLAMEAITNPLGKKLKELLNKKLPELFGKSKVDKLIKGSKEYSEDFINKTNDLVNQLANDKITPEEFLTATQKNGEKAVKYFVDEANTVDDTIKGVSDTLNKTISDVDSKAGEKWVKNAVDEVGDSKIKAIVKAIESFDPGYTTNHIQNVGLMLEQYINDPVIAKWLTDKGYDVEALKPIMKQIGESHDAGKLLISLHDINSKRKFPVGKNPVSPHEEIGEMMLNSLLEDSENAISGATNGETFASMANKHGQNKAETPLEQLVAIVDQMEAALSPRSYKKGETATSPKNFATRIVKGTDARVNYDFPYEVRKSLLDNYEKTYRTALETRYGKPIGDTWADVEKVQEELIHGNELSKYYDSVQQKQLQKAYPSDVAEKVVPVERETIEVSAKKPGKSGIRDQAYVMYNNAYNKHVGKNTRKSLGFVLGSVGFDPSSVLANVINKGNPEIVKNRLVDFNRKFQESDQDNSKKDAIQYITDNWDDLSDADKAYFKYRIEKDNKDFINGQ